MNLRILLLTVAVLALPASALADDMAGMDMKAGVSAASPADEAYKQAMQKMMQTTDAMKPTGDPDMDFVMMMKPHHQAAVEMAEAYLKYGKDPSLKKMAKDIIASQRKEIDFMDRWTSKHGM